MENLKAEEKILNDHLKEENIVETSLNRIRKFEKKIVTDHLFETEITEVLFSMVREKYSVETSVGRQARRILDYCGDGKELS